jgi:hypothetical protein
MNRVINFDIIPLYNSIKTVQNIYTAKLVNTYYNVREFLIKCYSIIQHCMLSEYPLLYGDLLRSVLPVLACQ